MTSIDALLSLLEDPDPRIHDPITARLGADGALLDEAWARASERGVPPRALVMLVLRADAEALVDAFAGAEDLESGAWILARLHEPRQDHRTPGMAALDQLAARVRASGACDGGQLATFLCGACGFGGAERDYDDPRNSYLPVVLERRVGLPIALTTLWLLLARRLGIAADAIAMPGHVLGRWSGGYLDLFSCGVGITRADLDRRARAAGEPSAGPFLAPASDRALLKRMARNLVHGYSKRGDQVRATIAHGMATS